MNADKDPDVVFRSTLYLMDIERITFSLNRYLRTRLRKIEEHLEYLVSNTESLECLSSRERSFAFELQALQARFTAHSFVDKLSSRQTMGGGEELLKHTQPQIQVISIACSLLSRYTKLIFVSWQDYVFCKVQEDIDGVDVGGNQFKDLSKGEIHVLSYNCVRNPVISEHIALI